MSVHHWSIKLFAVSWALAAAFCFNTKALAVFIVNDTWQDGTRTQPKVPHYSDNGSDFDGDGDLESQWFQGGGGTLDPAGPGGPLEMTLGDSGSSSWTTYFTPEGREVELRAAGEQLKVTWKFSLTGTSSDDNTSQNLRIAVTDSPAASRLVEDGAPGSQAYSGYAVFGNMGGTLNRSDPWELHKRADAGGNFLSSSGEWIAKVEDGDSGAAGYEDDVEYTVVLTLTRTAADGIDFTASISGGDLNGDGDLTATFADATPTLWNNTQPIPTGGFKFDTFGLRPSDAATTAAVFHTTSFTVEAPRAIPEPTSFVLIALGGLAIAAIRRL
jgi:hypothetical protein